MLIIENGNGSRELAYNTSIFHSLIFLTLPHGRENKTFGIGF